MFNDISVNKGHDALEVLVEKMFLKKGSQLNSAADVPAIRNTCWCQRDSVCVAGNLAQDANAPKAKRLRR